jgi:hypothetical protein
MIMILFLEGERRVKRIHSDTGGLCTGEEAPCHSQPVFSSDRDEEDGGDMQNFQFSFSQPTHINDMFISTEQVHTQSPTQVTMFLEHNCLFINLSILFEEIACEKCGVY